MRLRKLICLGLSAVMVLSAAGCGAATGASTAGDQPAAEAEAGASEADAAAEDSAEADAAQSEEEGAAQDAAAEAGGDTAAAEEIAPEDISVTWEDSHVYGSLTLGQYSVITTYGVKGYEDVPFIRVSDYLGILEEGRQKITLENGVMRVSVNGTEAVIDPAADTIVFENANKFRSPGEVDGASLLLYH